MTKEIDHDEFVRSLAESLKTAQLAISEHFPDHADRPRLVISGRLPDPIDQHGTAIPSKIGIAVIGPDPDSPTLLEAIQMLKLEKDIDVLIVGARDANIDTRRRPSEEALRTLREQFATFVLQAPPREPLPYFDKDGGRRRRKKRSQWGKQNPWD